MKRRYLLFAMLLVTALAASLAGSAQTKVYAYDYDASGNRVKRQLIQLKSASIASDNHEQKVFEGTLDKRDIKIYPNPTKGDLVVEIPFNEEMPRVTLQVYSLRGALVSEQLATSETTIVDLNRQPAGMYILRIFSGQSVSEWKIIKE